MLIHPYPERDASVSDNAARMLENNRKVLRKAFADNPDLPWWRKLKAISYLHFDAALEYGKERRLAALSEVGRSLLTWPLPMGRPYVRRLRRLRVTVCLLTGRQDTGNEEEAA